MNPKVLLIWNEDRRHIWIKDHIIGNVIRTWREEHDVWIPAHKEFRRMYFPHRDCYFGTRTSIAPKQEGYIEIYDFLDRDNLDYYDCNGDMKQLFWQHSIVPKNGTLDTDGLCAEWVQMASGLWPEKIFHKLDYVRILPYFAIECTHNFSKDQRTLCIDYKLTLTAAIIQ